MCVCVSESYYSDPKMTEFNYELSQFKRKNSTLARKLDLRPVSLKSLSRTSGECDEALAGTKRLFSE